MPTFTEALAELDEQRFVGRTPELALFTEWLLSTPSVPELLNVSGRGGVGKSTLLRAFARRARELGIPVVLADSRDFPHTPDGLLRALAPADVADPLGYLNTARPVVLLDTFDDIAELSRYLQQNGLAQVWTN